MKEVIINNVIENSDIAVSEEDSVYTKDYMVNNYPKLPWKGTNILGNAATITVSMPSTCNAIALFNIEAIEIVFTLYDDTMTLVETTTYDIDALTSYADMTIGTLNNVMQRVTLWIDYTYQYTTHTITLAIKNASGYVPSVGILRGGLSYNLQFNPMSGLQEGLIDYSLKKTNANGSSYYQKKDIIRTFSGSTLVNRNEEFYKIMSQIAQEKGEEPLAWKISNLGQNQWEVFGKLDGLPSGSHDLVSHSTLSWRITEAL